VNVVLLGGTPLSLSLTKQHFTTLVKRISIIGLNPGIINETEPTVSKTIIHDLQAIGPCVIAVALGQGKGRVQGKQERVMAQLAEHVPNARVIMGVGGAFDALSGLANRGPVVLRQFGFEWLWRAVREPWRARRIARAVLVFPWTVACDTLRAGRFLNACTAVLKALYTHFFVRS
jgi:N-acetylglucosaminyldiphosphoundecaprenol N-acetyl-beta-D-mannosaminyltransferase